MTSNFKRTARGIAFLFLRLFVGIILVLVGVAIVCFGIYAFPEMGEIQHGYIGYVVAGLFVVIPCLFAALIPTAYGIAVIINVVKRHENWLS
jgi:high-affinity K+ transport system ATPase subunit B